MIYDIDKTHAVNSHQILSVYFESAPTFKIKVIIAAGTGDKTYGGYGQPITYTVYQKSLAELNKPGDRLNEIKMKIGSLKAQLKTMMPNRDSAQMANVREMIEDLEKEQSDIEDPDYGFVTQWKQKQYESDLQANAIFHKFLQLLSDPDFTNSKEPVDFAKIL